MTSDDPILRIKRSITLVSDVPLSKYNGMTLDEAVTYENKVTGEDHFEAIALGLGYASEDRIIEAVEVFVLDESGAPIDI